MQKIIQRFCFWLESKLPKTTIKVNGKPYLTRCYLFGADREWGNIYLHHFHSSDQGLELHNHPWKWGLSFVISGGYQEERAVDPCFCETTFEGAIVSHKYTHGSHCRGSVQKLCEHNSPMKLEIETRRISPGKLNFISDSHFHRVDLNDETTGAFTLFFAGTRTKQWGFLDRETSEFRDWKTNPDAIP